jgi:hypothetical protein
VLGAKRAWRVDLRLQSNPHCYQCLPAINCSVFIPGSWFPPKRTKHDWLQSIAELSAGAPKLASRVVLAISRIARTDAAAGPSNGENLGRVQRR